MSSFWDSALEWLTINISFPFLAKIPPFPEAWKHIASGDRSLGQQYFLDLKIYQERSHKKLYYCTFLLWDLIEGYKKKPKDSNVLSFS